MIAKSIFLQASIHYICTLCTLSLHSASSAIIKYDKYLTIPYNLLVRCTSLLSTYSSFWRIILSRITTHPLLGGCAL